MSALGAQRALTGDYFDFTIDITAKLHAISAQLYAAGALLDRSDDEEAIKIGALIRTADMQVNALVGVVDSSSHTYALKGAPKTIASASQSRHDSAPVEGDPVRLVGAG